MLNLRLFRDRAQGLPDLLNWAALVDDGVVQGKDGALMAGYYYRGPDLASATPAERNALTDQVNRALSRLGSGWVTWQDSVRMPASGYPAPEASHFPDPISRLIDEERRAQFLAEGEHFESEAVLILYYLPPLQRHTRLADLFYDEGPTAPTQGGSRLLAQFQKQLHDLEDVLGSVLTLRRMSSYTVQDRWGQTHHQDELVNYLHFTLTGQTTPVHLPPGGMYLDAVVGGQDFWPGDLPRLGAESLACIALEGFPHESYPNLLALLEQQPLAYRWSSRMIYLDTPEALETLQGYRRKWRQKIRGFWSQVFRTQGGWVNEDALLMANQAEHAMTDASSTLVTFGYYTPVIVLRDPDPTTLMSHARALVRDIQREGFACRIETLNTVEAWLGSLPGHPLPNIRRPLIHTLTLADLLPLSSLWAGHDHAPAFGKTRPPLLQAATSGATPFRLNLHVGDVGHTLIFGPTGAGKSTLLATLAAQFLRYPGATVWAFDKGFSLAPLTWACGGTHLTLGGDGLGLAPLAELEQPGDVAWAQEWLCTAYQLQSGEAVTPRQRSAIHRALLLLQADKGPQERSLTDFVLTVQDQAIREALTAYTLKGPLGHLLDAQENRLEASPFTVFELDEVLNLGEHNALPVLLTLFRRFEQSLTGQPALLLLDEAWIMLGHPVFRAQLREWLKTLRKANGAVVLATQSLSDAVHSGLLDVLLESCPTKILLPNEEADLSGSPAHPGPREFYQALGLNETECHLLKTATKKRHYYYVSPEGRRLFDLDLGPIARAFVGVSGRRQRMAIEALRQTHGDAWPWEWLRQQGVTGYDPQTKGLASGPGPGPRVAGP